MQLNVKHSVIIVALLAVSGGLWWMQKSASSMTSVSQTSFSAQLGAAYAAEDTVGANETMMADKDMANVVDIEIGSPDAPITLIEYASFTCPHCADFHKNVFKQLKKEYIDTGKVRFVAREVYFDRYGLWAALVARCDGDTARYFAASDMFYKTLQDWAGSNNPNEAVQKLKKIGISVGMDENALDACLQDSDQAQALISHFEKNMEEYDVKGTPTLVINGVIYSNMSYPKLKELLDKLLEG